jgi:hypothetical protein
MGFHPAFPFPYSCIVLIKLHNASKVIFERGRP